jgi:DNA-binding PadR family transcriptional regulator
VDRCGRRRAKYQTRDLLDSYRVCILSIHVCQVRSAGAPRAGADAWLSTTRGVRAVRLTRDGLTEETDPDDEPGRVVYRITEAGQAELATWFATPVAPVDHPRDELAIKVALALETPGVDVQAVLQAQRTATLRKLRELTKLKTEADDTDDAWQLVLDLMIFRAESEARWLDHSETRLARTPRHTPRPQPADIPKVAKR